MRLSSEYEEDAGTAASAGSPGSGPDAAEAGGAPALAVPLELRWFVPGRLPSCLWRPDGRPRSRVDAYVDDSLRPDASVKRRGAKGPWEQKHRVDHAQVLMFGAVVVAEAWAKERRPRSDRPSGPATLVAKRIWRRAGVEVVDLQVEGEHWWSVAVKLGPSLPILRRLQPLVVAAASEGAPHSYPSWLLERRRSVVGRVEAPGGR